MSDHYDKIREDSNFRHQLLNV